MTCVFDSSAVIAHIKGEPGGAVVEEALAMGVMSAVNAAETISYFIRNGVGMALIRRSLAELAIPIVALDASLAIRAGELQGTTRRWGLSLGDCACLALAEARGEEAWTADRRWLDAGLPIKIKMIR